MTQETIEEGNKIIGHYEFPNLDREIKHGDFHNMLDKDKKIKLYLKQYDLLHYEKSWDSIMSNQGTKPNVPYLLYAVMCWAVYRH